MINKKDRLLLSCLVLQDIAHSLESISALKRQTIQLFLPLHLPSHTGKKKIFFVDTSHSCNVIQETRPFCPSKHREWATPSRSLRHHLVTSVCLSGMKFWRHCNFDIHHHRKFFFTFLLRLFVLTHSLRIFPGSASRTFRSCLFLFWLLRFAFNFLQKLAITGMSRTTTL